MSAVSSETDGIPLPLSVRELGASRTRMASSLGLGVLSAASVTVMVYLVETHVPEDPIMAAARYPAGKVILCMAVASVSAVLAWVIAIPALLACRFLPLLWLIPLVTAGVWFAGWYDWQGLFESGKAWRDVASP